MVWKLGQVCLVGVFLSSFRTFQVWERFSQHWFTLGNAAIGRICWQGNNNYQNSAGSCFFRDALSTTGQDCYCSAVTVSSTQSFAMFLRPSCQSHSHTQSRCQPTLTLPAATDRTCLSLQMMLRNPSWSSQGSWAGTATLPPAWNQWVPSAAPPLQLWKLLLPPRISQLNTLLAWLIYEASPSLQTPQAPQICISCTPVHPECHCPLQREMQNKGYF